MDRSDLRAEINRVLVIALIVASLAAIAVAFVMHARSEAAKDDALRSRIQMQSRELAAP